MAIGSLIQKEGQVDIAVSCGGVKQAVVAAPDALLGKGVLLPQAVQGLIDGFHGLILCPGGERQGGNLNQVVVAVIILGLHHDNRLGERGAEGHQIAAQQTQRADQNNQQKGRPSLGPGEDVAYTELRLLGGLGQPGGEGRVGHFVLHSILLIQAWGSHHADDLPVPAPPGH